MSNFYKTNFAFRQHITYAMIMATDSRGGIGLDNRLPWKGLADNKTDMQWFIEKTKGKIVVMGYNTWVSIGRKPLPGRVNIIISNAHGNEVRKDIESYRMSWMNDPKNHGKKFPTVMLAGSPVLAKVAIEEGIGSFHQGGEVMVIGGAKIYEAFMPVTSRLYLTTFDGEFEADTFVKVDLTGWELRYRDTMQMFQPKFEIWDVTKEVEDKADADIMQIEHIYRPAEGFVAELGQEKKDV